MITIQNLTKQYGKITALNNVTFNFNDEEVIAIMGENGAGKSTLLKICAGVLSFNHGTVTIDGHNIITNPIQARTHIGYLPEMPELYERLTGREFLLYIASLRQINHPEKKINEFSHLTGIDDALDFELGSYSKGMKQKISLISAMMHQPQNLLLDEPVYGLDPLTSRTIQNFIKQRHGSTIIATHSTQLVEQIADTVYILMKGHILDHGNVQQLLTTHSSIEQAYFHIKDEHHV